MYDNTEDMDALEQLKIIEKAQRAARYENKKEERETGLNYKKLSDK